MSNKAEAPKLNATTWSLLILLSLIWGGSFLFGRIAVLEIPPLTLVFLRVGIAALALNLWLMFAANGMRHTVNLWLAFAGMGILNNIIPFTLIFFGQQEIGAGLAAIINAMTPIWTVLIAHFTTHDEKLSTLKIAGVILGFAGVAVLIGRSAGVGVDASMIAQIAVVGATISYGFASVFGRRFSGIPSMETARGQLTMSAVLMLPLAALVDTPWSLPMPSASAIWSVLVLALICTAFAYILFFRILASAGAVNVALVTFLIPPSAIFLGIIFLDETLQLRQLAGMAIIMAGLVVIDGRLFKRH